MGHNAKIVLETLFPDQQECWFSVEMPRPVGLKAYAITSGKDASKAPMSWKLEGRTKTSTIWRAVDKQVGITFGANWINIFDRKMVSMYAVIIVYWWRR